MKFKTRILGTLLAIMFASCFFWFFFLKESEPLAKMASDYNIQNYYIKNGLLCDSVELDKRYLSVILEVMDEARTKVDEMNIHGRARSNFIQNEIKKILKDKHNIEWRTEQEMNPWICF